MLNKKSARFDLYEIYSKTSLFYYIGLTVKLKYAQMLDKIMSFSQLIQPTIGR